ncbi:unnamed protein product [Rotaria sp. Silwood1]|nr:unnamed protein product [Rotaria sp. Silwood1]CAF4565468.1 unnamed protein product [Rotaria sp. Silwood1]
MEVHTKLNILNCYREKICTYKTPKLTGITKRKHVEDFILNKCKNFKHPFDIQIYDKDDDFVTLDDDYLKDYDPFKAKTIDTTTVQPINSPTPTVVVQIILLNYAYKSIIDQELMKPEEILEPVIQKNEHVQEIDQFVSVSKLKKYPTVQLSNEPKMGFIPGYNVNSEQRDQLKLIAVVIEGAKKHPDVSLNILCQLENTYESELPDSSYDYNKSRLALVLQKDDVIQWETIVLSNEMVFKRNTANQRSKRIKKTSEEDHSSMTNLSTDINDSFTYLNQSLPVYYNERQVTGITSQTTLNTSPSDTELLSNLFQTNYLSVDSIHINNNYPDIFDYSDHINTNNIMLNADPSFCDTTDDDADLHNL